MSGWSQPSSRATEGGDTRLPVAVERPRARAPRGAELVRLRLPDRPGSLAAVTGHLAAHGVDVLRLDVVDRGSGGAVDDFLLAGAGIDAALEALGGIAILLGRRAGVDLRDPGLEMAAACEGVTSARSGPELCGQLVRAALGLVFAEAGLLFADREPGLLAVVASSVPGLPVAVDNRGNSLISSALFCGQSLTADGRIPWAPASLREHLPPGSVAVVPGGSPPSLALALVREDNAPFVAAELERLAALMRVAAGAFQLHETTVIRSRIRAAARPVSA
jgi:ACT domain